VIPIKTVLFQLILSLVVAVTTAYLTVWLSLRRFYREKWWEAKMEAYTNVIQALHHMNRDLDISLRAEMRGDYTESDYRKEWSEKHRLAWDEIRRQIDVGEFLYSPKSMRILRALIKDSEHDPDYMYAEHLMTLQSAVETCMPAIKAAARADLGLPPIRG